MPVSAETTFSTTPGSVERVGITSTHGTSSGGTNQWTPRNRPGLRSVSASSVIGIDEVFVAITVSPEAAASTSSYAVAFTSGRSKTASTTRSASATAAAIDAAAERWHSAVAVVPSSTLPVASRRARSSSARARASSDSSGDASTTAVGTPCAAKTCAMPAPIVPAPTTATFRGQAPSRHSDASSSASSSAAPISFGEPTSSRRWSSAPGTSFARSSAP